LGSDTGGSVRQPAAFCGIVGLRPTYGRISRFGLVAFASSLDQIGTFSRDVSDAALLMNVIAGHDNRDSTSANRSVPDYTDSLVRDVKGLRVGVPTEYFPDELDSDVQHAIDVAIEKLSELGAICQEVSLPHTPYGIAAYYLIATAEASSNLARYDGAHYGYRAKNINDLQEMYVRSRSEGFGDEVKRRIMLGTYVLSAGYFDKYYVKAQSVRALIQQDFRNAFENVDVLITPTAPTPAFRLDEKLDRPLEMYLSDIFTVPSALAGMPCISIPCGKSWKDLPVGIQLISKPFAENLLFRVGFSLETMF
jgi:aspartyl-tRNA(Asn)/glutamyl-tRNA(Gln) amidotransferase subunit A